MADDEKHVNLRKFKTIISIDFGSYGTAVHYKFPNVKDIYEVKHWEGMKLYGGGLDLIMQKKTLTALLWDLNNNKVICFGWKALKQYSNYQKYQNMIREGNNKGKSKMKKEFGDKNAKLVYFEHFKPNLLGDDRYIYPIGYDKNDINAPKLLLFDAITYSLIEIKKQAIHEVQKHRNDTGLDFKENEELKVDQVLWVLGTPVVWDDTSRGAFKQCVQNAGMQHHHIGVEPEFAVFAVKYYDKAEFFQMRKKFLMLDCGAGTTDATCVEVNKDRTLVEACARDGINKGSLMIDKQFYKMLDDIFGKEFMKTFKQKFPDAWNKIKFKFWSCKHNLDPIKRKIGNVETGNRFEKELKNKLLDHDSKEDIEDIINNLCQTYSKDIEYDEGILSIGMAIWKQFHEQLINETCEFLEKELSNKYMQSCRDVILVGGWTGSVLLKNELQNRFGKIRIHCCNDACRAVSIGGLFVATKVNDLRFRRRMWLTYGLQVNEEWDEKKDEKKHRRASSFSSSGYFQRKFDPIIFKNDLYKEHEQITMHYIIPTIASTLELKVYSVDSEKGVKYTSDNNCEVAACFELELTDDSMRKAAQQELPIIIELEKTMLKIIVAINGRRKEMQIRV